jgi:hypothetical protein
LLRRCTPRKDALPCWVVIASIAKQSRIIDFYFHTHNVANTEICENLSELRHLRAFDTDLPKYDMEKGIMIQSKRNAPFVKTERSF